MLNDDNTIGDIQGVIYCLQTDIHDDDPEFSVADQFSDLIERIEDKLSRSRNEIRNNWFTGALSEARAAQARFDAGDVNAAETALKKCLDGLTDGNKAHRAADGLHCRARWGDHAGTITIDGEQDVARQSATRHESKFYR